jgi:hypothetical protein
MVRLEPEELQEAAKERARRQPEPAVEGRDKHHALAELHHRHDLFLRHPDRHPRRDAMCLAEALHLVYADGGVLL